MVVRPTILQRILWPDPELCGKEPLYFRLNGPVAFNTATRHLDFEAGGEASFDTYGALFSVGKWQRRCSLTALDLSLLGTGHFTLSVHARGTELLEHDILELDIVLDLRKPQAIAIPLPHDMSEGGVLYFKLRAHGPGSLNDADWQSNMPTRRTPKLMLAITTYRREAAVTRTAARFQAFLDTSPLRAHLSLTVVDNGQSAHIKTSDKIRLVPNENLGGSGGFARGLLEAEAREATHCLFMDDDAAIPMDAIARTWAFLAYATESNVAIAGALSHAEDRTTLWENGALFDKLCYPQHIGLDLTDPDALTALECESTLPMPPNSYGGWWFFAFPLTAVRHMPFPYFVRGDDVSFCLAHDFTIVTLPGVMSCQEEDFSVKENPLTVYLDLRSHLTHHLALPHMDIGRRGIAFIIARFYLRSLLNYHYETLAAVALALDDVRCGPGEFAANADLATRRAEIGVLTKTERWRPHKAGTKARHDWLSPHIRPIRWLMKLTLNGHLLPGFGWIGSQRLVEAQDRTWRRLIWGAAKITYFSPDHSHSYTVRHSKSQAIWLTWRILRTATKLIWTYKTHKERWQTGYITYTSRSFWIKRLGLNISDHS